MCIQYLHFLQKQVLPWHYTSHPRTQIVASRLPDIALGILLPPGCTIIQYSDYSETSTQDHLQTWIILD